MLGLLDGVLLPELRTWAGQYQCGQVSTRHMPIDDLAHLVHSHNSLLVGGGGCVHCIQLYLHVASHPLAATFQHLTLLYFHPLNPWQTLQECNAGLEALGRLVEWNPHWGLETVRHEQGEVLGLSLAKHSTQILCHITSAIYSFFYLLIGIFTGQPYNVLCSILFITPLCLL